MNLEQIAQTSLMVDIIAAGIYAAALITTIILSLWQNKKANKRALEQSRYAFFAEYTRRYQDIIIGMPNEVFAEAAKAEGATLKYIRLYFDLCSEEFHLHQKKLIPDDVWNNWTEGMKLTTKIRVYNTAWKILADSYNNDFKIFMEHDIFKETNP